MVSTVRTLNNKTKLKARSPFLLARLDSISHPLHSHFQIFLKEIRPPPSHKQEIIIMIIIVIPGFFSPTKLPIWKGTWTNCEVDVGS